MFYALAENEDAYKDKINLFVACAPVTRMKYATGFNAIAPFIK
jgi:hypothetical protein